MRILLVTPFLPEPPVIGAIQRTSLLHQALTRLGDVDLLVVKRYPRLTEAEEALLPGFPNVVGVMEAVGSAGRRWTRGIEKVHQRLGTFLEAELNGMSNYRRDRRYLAWQREHFVPGRYDAIVSRYLSPMCRAGAFATTTPRVLDFDDPNHLYAKSVSDGGAPSNWHRRLRRKLESGVVLGRVRRCDHVFFICERDRTQTPGVVGSILANIPFRIPAETSAPDSATPRALFVGMLRYPPNADAIRHFLRRIWPDVRAVLPNARVRLVGNATPADAAAWAAVHGVEVAGAVPELDSHYAASTVCIAPIDSGGGTNIKVIEAAAHGRPSVITRFAHRGFETHLRDGVCLHAVDTDDQFAHRVIELLSNPARAASMGAAARAVALERYSFDSFASIVRDGVEAALATKKSNRR